MPQTSLPPFPLPTNNFKLFKLALQSWHVTDCFEITGWMYTYYALFGVICMPCERVLVMDLYEQDNTK